MLPFTSPKIIALLQEKLLVHQLQDLMNKEGSTFEDFIRQEKFEETSLLYRFYLPIAGGIEPICDRLNRYVVSRAEDFLRTYTETVAAGKCCILGIRCMQA